MFERDELKAINKRAQAITGGLVTFGKLNKQIHCHYCLDRGWEVTFPC